jgi:hypothetical protein
VHDVSLVKSAETSKCLQKDVGANFFREVCRGFGIPYILSKGATVHQFQEHPDLFVKIVHFGALDNILALRAAEFHDSNFIDNGLEFFLLLGFHIFEGIELSSRDILCKVNAREATHAYLLDHLIIFLRIIGLEYYLLLKLLQELFICW